MKKPLPDLTIVGDLIRFSMFLFVPFLLLGVIYGILHKTFFMSVVVNPIVYSLGISLIIVVIKHDLDELGALIGIVKESQLGLNIKHAKEIQEVACLMAVSDFAGALKKTNALLREEADFVNGLSLKGQILLEGFQEHAQARECFEKVLALTKPEEEQHKVADSLIASCYCGDD